METWEDMIKTLPSDETLEKLEKNGTLAEYDRKLVLLDEEFKRLKEKMSKDSIEIDKMFEEIQPQEETAKSK